MALSFSVVSTTTENHKSLKSLTLIFGRALTLIGIGCGPWIAGELSDHFARSGAAQPLARSLEIILLFNAASIFCLLMATRNYRKDAERAAL